MEITETEGQRNKRLSWQREYYRNNKERCIAANKAWMAQNPERVREIAREGAVRRRLKDPQSTRLRGRGTYNKAREKVISVLGGRCSKCGFDDMRALQVDHVNGGGSKKKEGGVHYWNCVIRNAASGEYQLLCANCNWIKRYENDEVPRKD